MSIFDPIADTLGISFQTLRFGSGRRRQFWKVPTPARLLEAADRAYAHADGDRAEALHLFNECCRGDPELARMLTDSALGRIFYGRRRRSRNVKLSRESQELENWVCKALRRCRGQTRPAARMFREWMETEPRLVDELHRWEMNRILEVDEGL